MVETFVQHCNLIIAHVVVNDHATTAYKCQASHFVRIEPTNMHERRQPVIPYERRGYDVLNSRLQEGRARRRYRSRHSVAGQKAQDREIVWRKIPPYVHIGSQ